MKRILIFPLFVIELINTLISLLFYVAGPLGIAMIVAGDEMTGPGVGLVVIATLSWLFRRQLDGLIDTVETVIKERDAPASRRS